MDVSAKVSAFSEANDISLVLRHVNAPTDTNSRQSILETVNNPVVFEKGRDITDFIIQQTNSPIQQAVHPGGQRR